jgi:GNAT superfamily N-acetyltransferase
VIDPGTTAGCIVDFVLAPERRARGLGTAILAAVVREIRASGIETLTGIARTLQARGVRTPRGRVEWQPVQVSRLLAV